MTKRFMDTPVNYGSKLKEEAAEKVYLSVYGAYNVGNGVRECSAYSDPKYCPAGAVEYTLAEKVKRLEALLEEVEKDAAELAKLIIVTERCEDCSSCWVRELDLELPKNMLAKLRAGREKK